MIDQWLGDDVVPGEPATIAPNYRNPDFASARQVAAYARLAVGRPARSGIWLSSRLLQIERHLHDVLVQHLIEY